VPLLELAPHPCCNSVPAALPATRTDHRTGGPFTLLPVAPFAVYVFRCCNRQADTAGLEGRRHSALTPTYSVRPCRAVATIPSLGPVQFCNEGPACIMDPNNYLPVTPHHPFALTHTLHAGPCSHRDHGTVTFQFGTGTVPLCASIGHWCCVLLPLAHMAHGLPLPNTGPPLPTTPPPLPSSPHLPHCHAWVCLTVTGLRHFPTSWVLTLHTMH